MSNGMLATGKKLVTEAGEQVTVGELFGSGGQGEVYRVSTVRGDRAVKWYYPQLADARQRHILEGLIEKGWDDDRFLWPRSIVMDPDGKEPGFGYLMDVRPARFQDLPALFRRDPSVKEATMRTLVTVALHTVEAYRALHSKGIAYRDINWGNIFFDPRTGDVLVCDNDNAVVEGGTAGVAGTMDFMAPELVRGDRGAQPGTQTDLHSLAVLLFLLLMNEHPFNGALAMRIHCMGEAAKRKLYGTDPVFVYDPADTRNRPVAGEQPTVIATWAALPQILRDLFVQTFTDGLRTPAKRVRETQWRDALSQVLDAITQCRGCGRQNLTQPDGTPPDCWKCGRPLQLPPRLELVTATGTTLRTRRGIRLDPSARVYAHHLDGDPDRHDFRAIVGEVTEHPKQRGRYGLTNRTQNVWTVRKDDGSVREVEPGRTIALQSGLLLEFGGGVEAEVKE
ncbi:MULTISPECIES: protein kinase domain-containing protein [Streptomyces]|uniref:Protein kinase n=1 Tax=Streptomyces alboflavus TaxID=67267 RepID=A0A1Z1WLC6_9ACTN|nr:protein kinase [Streptomyces alboflavus]ARX87190.1 protein kinase [Streptomyces alboflavus]